MNTIHQLETPALLVDTEIMERNLALMAQLVINNGKSLRPHTKTHKTPFLARLQLEAGACGLTAAKLGEAEVLADAGCEDIFVANQILGDIKIERLFRLAERCQLSVGVDSLEVAEPLNREASRRNCRLSVVMEVDTGLGRAGVRTVEEAVGLAQTLEQWKSLKLKGIFTHEGHLYREVLEARRREVASEAAGKMEAIALDLQAMNIPCPLISMGSTPGTALLATAPNITEMRPGVYIFNDRMQVRLGAAPSVCALTVLATVISVRNDGHVIIDAGTKALASDCPFADKTYGDVLGYPDFSFISASEEHGVLQANGLELLRVGDRIRIVPNHACTCVNMHERFFLTRQEEVLESVWIAGRGKMH